MAINNKELTAKIDALFENETDPARLKKLAEFHSAIEEKQKEEDALLKKSGELAEAYKKVIMNDTLTPKNDPDETGSSVTKPKSFEDCINEVLSASKGK